MANDKRMVKDAVRDVITERTVTFGNGAVQFVNAMSESMARAVDAFDDFFLRNFLEDQPGEAADPVLNARLAAARQQRAVLDKKVAELERIVKSRQGPRVTRAENSAEITGHRKKREARQLRSRPA